MAAQNLNDPLQRVLADGIVFYQKLRHFHWSVTGPHFFALHGKFEELYDRWSDLIDDVAERVLQLGGRPVPTLAAALETAGISEQSDVPDGRAMVRQVIADLETQLAGFRKAIAAAEAAGDRSTANLLDGAGDETEKTLWMLRAWLAE